MQIRYLLLSQMAYTRVRWQMKTIWTVGYRDIVSYQMERGLGPEIALNTDIVHGEQTVVIA